MEGLRRLFTLCSFQLNKIRSGALLGTHTDYARSPHEGRMSDRLRHQQRKTSQVVATRSVEVVLVVGGQVAAGARVGKTTVAASGIGVVVGSSEGAVVASNVGVVVELLIVVAAAAVAA